MALSDLLSPALELSSTILKGGADITKGYGYRAIGARRQAENEFEAQQLEQDAGQSQAVSQRNAEDEKRKATLINSTALARAAASGAGASDPTVMKLIAQTAGEGAYRSALALYQGEAQAKLDRTKAAALRYEGAMSESDAENAQRASNLGALSTALSGGAKFMSMFDKYWAGPTSSNGASLPAGGSGVTTVDTPIDTTVPDLGGFGDYVGP